jgi:hypothetical protein
MTELKVSKAMSMILLNNFVAGRANALKLLLSQAEAELPHADEITITLRKSVPDEECEAALDWPDDARVEAGFDYVPDSAGAAVQLEEALGGNDPDTQ